jgi:transcriptional regulator with XRE-family HTH domain
MMTSNSQALTLKDFGNALRSRRLKLAISIAKQAKELNVSAEDYAAYEAGMLVPPALVVKKLFSWQPFLKMYQPVLVEGRKEPETKPAPLVMVRSKVAPPPPMPPKQVLVEVTPEKPVVEVLPEPVAPAVAEAVVATAPAATHAVWPIQAVIPKNFGEALRYLRTRAGFNLVELGVLLGLDQTSISSWELEKTNPTSAHYHELIKLFPELANADVPACRHMTKPGRRLPEKAELAPKSEPLIHVQKEEVLMPEPKQSDDHKRHMVNWSKTLVAYHNSPEKVQQSVKSLLTSAHGMGFTIPELLEMLSEDA